MRSNLKGKNLPLEKQILPLKNGPSRKGGKMKITELLSLKVHLFTLTVTVHKPPCQKNCSYSNIVHVDKAQLLNLIEEV